MNERKKRKESDVDKRRTNEREAGNKTKEGIHTKHAQHNQAPWFFVN